MGIETSVANRRNKEFVKLGMEKDPRMPRDPTPKSNPKSRGKKPRRRHKVAAASPVQKLYDTCKEVFALCGPGIVPSSDNISKLKAVLDGIKPADVGLNPEMPYFRTGVAGRTPAIRYLHLHACKKFSMGIFCLPPSGVLPLHNHPGMTVFSKLLFGTMHIKSYDWVLDTSGNASLEASTSQSKCLLLLRVVQMSVGAKLVLLMNMEIRNDCSRRMATSLAELRFVPEFSKNIRDAKLRHLSIPANQKW